MPEGVALLEQYRALARYNTWMNERLYAIAATIADADRRRDLGAFFGSVHGTLNHILLADRAWLGRFTGDPALWKSYDDAGREIVVRTLDQELYTDFTTLRREHATTGAALAAWIDALDEAQLGETLRYRTGAGEACAHPLWQAVTHLFNHQTHHRGQLTTLFRQLGVDPGVTDFAVMIR